MDYDSWKLMSPEDEYDRRDLDEPTGTLGCPECGEPDDHKWPVEESQGRCINCCPACIAFREEAKQWQSSS